MVKVVINTVAPEERYKYLIKYQEKNGFSDRLMSSLVYNYRWRIIEFPSPFSYIGIALEKSNEDALNEIKKCLKLRILKSTPQEHQLNGIRWMRNIEKNYDIGHKNQHGICGGILSFKMGLGKTFTSLLHSMIYRKSNNPSLIICSKTTIIEWKNEIKKHFSDHIKFLIFTKYSLGKNFDSYQQEHFLNYDYIITTYDTLRINCRKWIKRCTKYTENNSIKYHIKLREGLEGCYNGSDLLFTTMFERLISDESHIFNNHKTITFKSMMCLRSKYSWCLTGTPMRNCVKDLWTLYKFIGFENKQHKDKMHIKAWKGKSTIENYKLKRFINVMDYEKANVKLVERVDKEYELSINGIEKKVYDLIKDSTVKEYNNYITGKCSYLSLLAMFTRLRQVCNSCCTLSNNSTGDSSISLYLEKKYFGGKYDINGVEGIKSVKMKKIIEILELLPKGEKCIIFSTFVTTLTVIKHALKNICIKHCCIIGKNNKKERDNYIESFKNDDDITVMLATYKCGSEGLNLTVANHVICVEPWWTPAVEEQAIARCHRFGQQKPVIVYKLYIKDSIELKMVKKIKDRKNVETRDIFDIEDKTKTIDSSYIGKVIGVL